MPAAPDQPTGRRFALIVATGTYADPALAKLRAPGRDAADFAAVLEDAALGGFEVETVLDEPADVLRRRIARFCAQGGPGDLALVYLSCHGVLDDRGRLYYATSDTDRELLAATALPSAWLNEQLEDCRCRRQILILDCCHSGAFAQGAKGEHGLALGERFEGRGRVVLTGSRATEYSFEREEVVGDSPSSIFTGVLIDGLRSGDADRDRDGVVTVKELYDYAYDAVRATEAPQTPGLWTHGFEGDLLVAHSPRGAIVEPLPLPDDLVALLESARPRVREGAVAELADLLAGSDPGRALTARTELERVAEEDVPSVAAAARKALEGEVAAEAPPARPVATPRTDATASPARPSGTTRPLVRQPRVLALAAVALLALVVGAVLLAGGGADDPPAPGPGGVSVAGAPHGIAVGEGGVWVARHDDDAVSRIDTVSGQQSIELDAAPDRIAAGDGAVWALTGGGTRLVRIDPATRKVTRRVRVDARPLPGCGCASPGLQIAAGELWVASPRDRSVSSYDLETGELQTGPYKIGQGFGGAFAVGAGAIWAVRNDFREPSVSWLVRLDVDSGEDKQINMGTGSHFEGVAYGRQWIWIADSADGRNMAASYDVDSGGTSGVKVDSGITSEDIAARSDVVFVWEPERGILTQIDAPAGEVVRSTAIKGYTRDEAENKRWSDLALDDGSAWVSDPVGDAVYKIDY